MSGDHPEVASLALLPGSDQRKEARMRLFRNPAPRLTFTLLLVLLGGCGPSITSWGGHRAFLVIRERLVPADSGRASSERARYHRALQIERLFLRGLPVLATGSPVVAGLEIGGVLPDRRPVHLVLPPRPAEGGAVTFTQVGRLRVFRGQVRALTARVSVKAVSETEAVDRRIAKALGADASLDPGSARARRAARALFDSLAFRAGDRWHTFALAAPRGGPRASLRVYLVQPRPGKRRAWRGAAEELALQGTELVWRTSGRAYRDTPYLVVRIPHYARYPGTVPRLSRLEREAEQLSERRRFAEADRVLAKLEAAIRRERRYNVWDVEIGVASAQATRAALAVRAAQARGDTPGVRALAEALRTRAARALARWKTRLLPAELRLFRSLERRMTHLRR